MQAVWEALAEAELWQLAIAALLVVVGSSAASALVAGLFESRRHSKGFRRESRARVLDALGVTNSLYVKYGNSPLDVEDEDRDQALAKASSSLVVAVAATGKPKLIKQCSSFMEEGELFASHALEGSAGVLNEEFVELARKLAKGIPAR